MPGQEQQGPGDFEPTAEYCASLANGFPGALGRYRLPRPRIGIGPLPVDFAIETIDGSDSLRADREHICKSSNMSAAVRSRSFRYRQPRAAPGRISDCSENQHELQKKPE